MVYKVKRFSILDQREYGYMTRAVYRGVHPGSSWKDKQIVNGLTYKHRLTENVNNIFNKTPGQNIVDIGTKSAEFLANHPATASAQVASSIGEGALWLANPALGAAYSSATAVGGQATLMSPITLALDKKARNTKLGKILTGGVDKFKGSPVSFKIKNGLDGVVKSLPGYTCG